MVVFLCVLHDVGREEPWRSVYKRYLDFCCRMGFRGAVGLVVALCEAG